MMSILGDSVKVVKGSALAALENGDSKCIEDLLQALDEIPLPQRKDVRSFFSQKYIIVFSVVLCRYCQRKFCLFRKCHFLCR